MVGIITTAERTLNQKESTGGSSWVKPQSIPQSLCVFDTPRNHGSKILGVSNYHRIKGLQNVQTCVESVVIKLTTASTVQRLGFQRRSASLAVGRKHDQQARPLWSQYCPISAAFG